MLMASYINSRGQHKNILHKRTDTKLRLLANSHASQVSRFQTAATMDIWPRRGSSSMEARRSQDSWLTRRRAMVFNNELDAV